MPLNKSAISRYLHIDYLLRKRRLVTLENIIDYVSTQMGLKISKRTIQLDLQEMRHSTDLGFLAPIKCSASGPAGEGRKFYQYEDKEYSIRKKLNLTDMNLIEIEDPKIADAVDALLQQVGTQDLIAIQTTLKGYDISHENIKHALVCAADALDDTMEKGMPREECEESLEALVGAAAFLVRAIAKYNLKQPDLETVPA